MIGIIEKKNEFDFQKARRNGTSDWVTSFTRIRYPITEETKNFVSISRPL